MTYKLMVKRRGRWERVGFDHCTVEEARTAAFRLWREYVFLIVPA
jgi:hypothetical protein